MMLEHSDDFLHRGRTSWDARFPSILHGGFATFERQLGLDAGWLVLHFQSPDLLQSEERNTLHFLSQNTF